MLCCVRFHLIECWMLLKASDEELSNIEVKAAKVVIHNNLNELALVHT